MPEAMESNAVGQNPPAPLASESDNFTGANEEAVIESLRADLESSEPTEQQEETSGDPVEGEHQEATQDEQGEETGDNWLPSDQEKEFPLATLQRFGKRYGYNADEIAGDKRLQLQLKDHLNSAILLRQDDPQATEGEEGEEQYDEGETYQAESEPQPQQVAQPVEPQAAYQQRLDKLVSLVQPQAAQQLGMNVITAFMGGNDPAKQLEQATTALRNPNLPPDQRAQLQANVQDLQATIASAGQVGNVLARGAADLVATVLPSLLPELIEQIYPGTAMRYEVGLAAEAWQNVKDAKGQDGKAIYSNLPVYHTPEFQQLIRKTERQLGLPKDGLSQMFPGLPKQEQFSRVYNLIAKIASGQRLNPAVVARAVETGKRIATEATGRRAQGRVLGAGRGAGRIEQSADPMRDALSSAISGYNEDISPTQTMRKAGA